MQWRWTEVLEDIGWVIIEIGEQVLDENLHIECLLSPLGEGGRHVFDVASNTRWDKRGGTCRYDSLSGCAIAFGLCSDLLIGIKQCLVFAPNEKRGLNMMVTSVLRTAGLGKGMEATGTAKLSVDCFKTKSRSVALHALWPTTTTLPSKKYWLILNGSYWKLIEYRASLLQWAK
jgi:hypothetical protein